MAKKAKTRTRKPRRTGEQRKQDEITFTQDLYYLATRGYARDFEYVDIPPAVDDFTRNASLNELQTVMLDVLLAIRDRTPEESPPFEPAAWITAVPRNTPAPKKAPRKTSGAKKPRVKSRSAKSPGAKKTSGKPRP